WIADGFAVGQLIELQGSAENSTSDDVPYTITGVSATVLTLSKHDLIHDEATAGAPEAISITRGVAPTITTIQIQKITPLNVNATGVFNVTAGKNVYLNSTITMQLDQVSAGDIITGADIRMKGKQSILNAGAPAAINLRGASIILEAATGSVGSLAKA